jgi:hypothetical protein
MNLPGREAKVARRISDLSEQYIEGQKKPILPSGSDPVPEKPCKWPGKDAVRGGPRRQGCPYGTTNFGHASCSRWEYEQRYCLLACEWDGPISGNPSRSMVHGQPSFYVLYPLMGTTRVFFSEVGEPSEFTGPFSPWTKIRWSWVVTSGKNVMNKFRHGRRNRFPNERNPGTCVPGNIWLIYSNLVLGQHCGSK